MVGFGQLVVGPPGAGKSTFCDGMQQLCTALGRSHVVVNLDPANDQLPYECHIDVKDLITVEGSMVEHDLGPNGGLIYCIEYLLANFDWLECRIRKQKDSYFIFDCAGQVELFTHHEALRNIISLLEKKLDLRLTVVHLVDSTFCTDPIKYISALIVSLGTQAQLELPHVNVLSKIDLLKLHSSDLDFRIEYYAQAEGLSHLLRIVSAKAEHPLDKKFSRFEESLCELIEDFNLISFHLLDVQDKDSMLKLLKAIDTSNGYCIDGIQSTTTQAEIILKPTTGVYEDCFGTIQERYVDEEEE